MAHHLFLCLASNCTLEEEENSMNKVLMKDVAMNAMIASLYAVLTIIIAPIAYGGIQFRITEVMVFLAFYNKRYICGLTIGCFLANMASPMGIWDMSFGTIATLMACIAMYKIDNMYLAAIMGSVINGLLVGAELYFALELPFLINVLYVFIGEIVVLVIGIQLFHLIERNTTFMKKYIEE